MRRADFFLVEAVRALRNNLATTVAATVTVLIVLYFLGVFVLFGTYLYAKVDKERSGVRVTVYLDKRASDQQVAAIGARLRQNPDVKPSAVEFVSKAEAWQRLKERVPKTVWESVLTNPLPASWEASLAHPDNARSVANSVRNMPGAEKGPNGVKYGGKDADRLLRNAAVVELVIGGLILILAISAIALIANTIRLSIFARRREVEVMKLVGASNWFVRLPFVLEGMLCGLGGAVLSILLLGISLVLLKDHLPAASLNEDGAHAIAFWLLAPLLLLAGTLLGAIGSGVTMRRFLRV
jgi:cell division transport system permease protein